MICFLTSRIDNPDTGELNSANRFIYELRLHFPNPCRALDICSNPDDWDKTDYYASLTKKMFEDAGFSFEQFYTLDSRNEDLASKLVQESNLLILSGGHVPTQNLFFEKIRLRELIKDFDGIVIGISAGSMNSADTVYSQPEEEGEAVDPAYQKFLSGLNLTKTNLLPHYQENKNDVLDGLRLYDDIACADSIGKRFYAIPDGSYLFINGCNEELRGEAYMVENGMISQISSSNDVVSL
jgi:dipeptidase E